MSEQNGGKQLTWQTGIHPYDGYEERKKARMSEPPALYGYDLFGETVKPPSRGALADRFEFPPFSVLDARQGSWQERKQGWLSLGIKSELGRVEGAPGGSPRPAADYRNGERGDGSGKPLAAGTGRSVVPGGGGVSPLGWRDFSASQGGGGASIFDPVLTELCYRWFCPAGGQVVDPFAGGSVRGLVAGLLGFRYHGIELRATQVAANEAQRGIAPPDSAIEWRCGDSATLLQGAPDADFILACPPYGDLERYSDDPADLSTMDYPAFLAAYRDIIRQCAAVLKMDRLAAFVVGDFRDRRTGYYRGFVADTVNAFREAGMALYNDAILVTVAGSLPIRVSGQFEGGRKLGKTHQNVLVFAKGDPRKAFER